MDSDENLESLPSLSHIRRGLTLATVSILAITVTGLGYLHPSLAFGVSSHPESTATKAPSSSYQLTSVDFVSPSTGWVLAERQPNRFAVLHTMDAGATWTEQLRGSAGDIGEYVRFFDSSHGVLVVLGQNTLMFRTGDGGGTWSRNQVQRGGGFILSAAFVDADHGWLLAQNAMSESSQDVVLFRTQDGGVTWAGLGDPVLTQDMAFRVVFADPNRGWLYSRSAGPYAYRTADGGVTWHRLLLSAPPGGWPTPANSSGHEVFFVAARPTEATGVVATVIAVAPQTGRANGGGVVVGYPPLTVRAFDGGRAVTYVYRTLADTSPYRFSAVQYEARTAQIDTGQTADQVQLSSVDGGLSWRTVSPPSALGAIGYIDALNWWWIGSGSWSTTSDGGNTWTHNLSLGVVEPLPGSLQFLDASHAWFGAMAGTRPLLESTDDGGVSWTMNLLPPITP